MNRTKVLSCSGIKTAVKEKKHERMQCPMVQKCQKGERGSNELRGKGQRFFVSNLAETCFLVFCWEYSIIKAESAQGKNESKDIKF